MSRLLLGLAFCALYATSAKWFDRIIIFMFENHSEKEVLADPNFSKFARMGVEFHNYFALTHPSQPNYWCQVAGDYFGINSDGNHDLNYRNLADLLEEKEVSWKLYQEDYPGNCRTDATIGKYARKHNPFISFLSVQKNATRCAKIVNSTELDDDLASGSLPQFMYFTPNLNNDGHDTGVTYAGNWLGGFLTPRLTKFPPGTLIVITWDEDDYTEANQIYTSMFDPQGKIVVPNTIDSSRYNHYSLLRTIEDNFALGTLGRNDTSATPLFKTARSHEQVVADTGLPPDVIPLDPAYVPPDLLDDMMMP